MGIREDFDLSRFDPVVRARRGETPVEALERCAAAGMTVHEAAEEVGVSHWHAYRLARGKLKFARKRRAKE